MAHHNYLIGHNTNPDRNKTNPSRLTALTPQNQPERPLLRGNQDSRAYPATEVCDHYEISRKNFCEWYGSYRGVRNGRPSDEGQLPNSSQQPSVCTQASRGEGGGYATPRRVTAQIA